jgi:suppressor of tumorigenicity protein 13
MKTPTPQEVLDVISKLDSSDQEIIWNYIETLGGTLPTDFKSNTTSRNPDTNDEPQIQDDDSSPPMYESGEDYDLATTYKMEATDLKSNGDYTGALEKYNLAVTSAPPSALLLANRADVLLKLEQYKYAVQDCNTALDLNPDSAKAMRIRGKAYKSLGEYEKSRHDLSAAQQIDYDDGTAEDLKFVTEKMREIEAEIVHQRLEEEEKLRKKAEEIKKAREEAKQREWQEANEAKASSGMGGMPNMPGGGMGGMPGGMGGMQGLLSAIMSDPELATALQNPKVMTALTSMMSNPGKAMEMMNDPDVGPVMQKLMAKLGPMMGGMGGMPGGGMGGMPDFGGANDTGDDGMEDLPDLDDLPDLE